MSRNRVRFYISLAVVFALFCMVAFVLPVERAAVFWLSFLFAVVAVAAQVYAWPRAFDFEGHDVRSRFYGFPLARLAVLYLIAQLALSLICMLLCLVVKVPVWLPVLLFASLLGAFVVGLLAVDAVKEEVERQDEVLKAQVYTVRSLHSKTASLAAQCADPETKKLLDKLAEDFRYSDPVSTDALVDIEDELIAQVDELQSAVLEKDYAAVQALCAKAEATLAERNRRCKLNK